MKDVYIADTSIFMYARGKDHHYKKPCADLVLAFGDGSFEQKYGQPVVDSEIFQEILYRYSLIGQQDTAVSLLKDIYALGLEILAIGKKEIEKMIELAAEYKNENITPRDIVHAAVMITNDIKKIISADKDFDRIEEIQRIDPADF
ncbi:MAG: type II toxin-antitoxin system VapC family toxin [Actinobacteria bacterium]|nr:type II toxin-antitoxin system VapC family toxin [Actinomycetota bacterium]